MIKRFEIEPRMHVRVNQNIPGLRKKVPFSRSPANKRWFKAFSSYERNGVLNYGLSANWPRLAYPMAAAFLMMYMLEPVLHGTVYIKENHNYQWEPVYHKLGMNRPPMCDQTINRIA